MKRSAIAVILYLMISILVANEGETSEIATFFSKTGSLLIKEYHSIATVKSQYGPTLKLDVLYITDATTNTTRRGLRIEAEEKKSYGISSSRSLLDTDEVESLLSALDYIANAQMTYGNDKNQPYRELKFSSKDSFEFGVFISEGNYTAFATVGLIGKITLFFKFEDIHAIRNNITTALAELKG
ncbi:MAG: hypothetical protein PHO37_19115 [Kiritimatiellae bacterium]|nr:hypothetical protein [Kiritimatiellia bacterium]